MTEPVEMPAPGNDVVMDWCSPMFDRIIQSMARQIAEDSREVWYFLDSKRADGEPGIGLIANECGLIYRVPISNIKNRLFLCPISYTAIDGTPIGRVSHEPQDFASLWRKFVKDNPQLRERPIQYSWLDRLSIWWTKKSWEIRHFFQD